MPTVRNTHTVQHYIAFLPVKLHHIMYTCKQTHSIQITPASQTERKRADVYTQLLFKTTKESMLIGQMGSFFYVHALDSISITTEDHSCESSLVSAQREHTHTPQKSNLAFWFIYKHESMQRCTIL